MQGKLIIGAILIAVLGPSAAIAGEPGHRQSCQRSEAPQQIQQAPPRQQQAQPQQVRSKPQGCPVTRTIPSVVDPTPIFLL